MGSLLESLLGCEGQTTESLLGYVVP